MSVRTKAMVLSVQASAIMLICAPAPASEMNFDLPPCDGIDSGTQRVAPSKNALQPMILDATKDKPSYAKNSSDTAQILSDIPTALTPSWEERKESDDLTVAAQRQQLHDLWVSTIDTSPDIRFVIERLQPKQKDKKETSRMLRAVGALLFGAMDIAPLAAPTGLTKAGAGLGSRVITNFFRGGSEGSKTQTQVTEEEAAVLYVVVRETADKVLRDYREYRKARNELTRAQRDLDDAQTLAARWDSDSAMQQAVMHFTVGVARRYVEKAEADLRCAEEQLAERAGAPALSKLSSQVALEESQLKLLVGRSDVLAPALKVQPSKTAQGGVRPNRSTEVPASSGN